MISRMAAGRKMMAAAYQEHPYQHPIIGWMNDLQNLSVNDARAWYQRWYVPGNAVLVVAGDVRRARCSNWRSATMAAYRRAHCLRAGHLASRRRWHQAHYRQGASTTAAAGDGLPCAHLARPQKRQPDLRLQVLAGILDGNESARLNRALVREQQLASKRGRRL